MSGGLLTAIVRELETKVFSSGGELAQDVVRGGVVTVGVIVVVTADVDVAEI